MSVFEWSDSFMLGIPELDEHHKQLIALLNKTYDCFISSKSSYELNLLVDDLIEYARYHFEAEEQLMKRCDYPLKDEHIAEHEIFTLKSKQFKELLHGDKSEAELEILRFLKEWLANHVLNVDKKFGYYLDFNPH
jgi:hemerythrin